MRVAVLIVGEFRTFEYARPHHAFLDQRDLDIDVYFQTWDKSRMYNGVRVNHRDWHTISGPTQPITQEYVASILKRPATINVCQQPSQSPDIPMIYGWLMGMDLIRNSGKTYDYVFMLRPDLFWAEPPLLVPELIQKFSNKKLVGFSLIPPTLQDGLEDALLFASFEAADKIFNQALVEKVKREGYGGWHNLWHDYIVGECGLEIVSIPMKHTGNVIARFPLDHNSTFNDARHNWHLWWHQQEKIAMCVMGDFNTYPHIAKSLGFLTQPGVMAMNYFTFYKQASYQLTGSKVRITQNIEHSNVPQAVKSIPEQTYLQVLEPHPGYNYFEHVILQWLDTFELIDKSKQNIYYALLVRSNVLFENSTCVNMEPIWPLWNENNPYEQGFSVSTSGDGKYNVDIVFGKLALLKTLINEQLLQDWRQEVSNGNYDWRSFWHARVKNYVQVSLPLTETDYTIVMPWTKPDMTFAEIKKVHDVTQEYQTKIVPMLNQMQATSEVRHLWIPDILKQNFALRDLLVIFDLDGVLLESKEMHYETLNAALAEVDPKYVISLEDHHDRYDGLPTTKKLSMLTLERGLPEQEHQRIWMSKQRQTVRWLRNMNYTDDKLVNLFKVLKSQNCMIAVASNSIRDTVKTALLYMNLIDHVDYFISNEDVRRPKPHPEMFWRCMIDLNFTPDNTMVVEDSPVGLRAAHYSGAQVIKVGNPYEITVDLLEDAAQKLKGKKSQ